MFRKLYYGLRQLVFWNNFFDITFLSLLIKPINKYNQDNNCNIDYLDVSNWYYHPDSKIKKKKYDVPQKRNANVHVFFLHRTTFFSLLKWNASINKNSDRTIKSSIYIPMNIFKDYCRIYVPKYRQATLFSFFDMEGNGENALNLAYNDVKNSFSYFLNHIPKEDKIVLAGHSQGTFHLIRLIEEFFENNSALQERLLIAYLVGYPVPKNRFTNIPMSENELDHQCYVSWSTFGKKCYPKYFPEQYDVAHSTNPVSWSENSEKNEHLGGVSYNLTKKDSKMVSVVKLKGVLQISKPKWYYPCLPNKDFVIMDYNLFFEDIKKNFIERLKNAI